MNTLFQRLWRPGIRLQLMFWYTTVFAVVLLVTGIIFALCLEHSLETSLDVTLRIQVSQVCQAVDQQNSTIIIHDSDLMGFFSPPGNDSSAGSSPPNQDWNNDLGERVVRLLDANGKVLRASPASLTLDAPTSSMTDPLHGQSWVGTVTASNGDAMRLYSEGLTKQGKVIAVVQVGQSLSHLYLLLRQLVTTLLEVGVLALLICAASSYLLTRRAFAPIQHLTGTARKIKDGDLHQRIPLPAARDEIRHLALTFNEMLDALDSTFTRQRRFVSDASHELRTPVAVIRNKAGIALLDGGVEEDYTSVLQEINAEAERLGHLISDLLALARGDEGEALFEREPVRMDRLVEAVVANAEVLAAERDIALTLCAETPVTIVGDEARLIQVVMNLLDNALRYTPVGGKVSVSVDSTSSAARLHVRDTGIGIAPQHLPHIFERFYRADPARQQTGGSSSGLGLSIVEWIVRVHGGSIEVESQVGQGSCFIVTLPDQAA